MCVGGNCNKQKNYSTLKSVFHKLAQKLKLAVKLDSVFNLTPYIINLTQYYK